VAREALWLASYNPADGLPALAAANDGPFDVVQAYRARSPRQRATQLYVTRASIREDRFANIRRQAHYIFRLQLIWPLSNMQGSAEADQQNLDSAVQLVLLRIGGLTLDKTHGGQFLQAAEIPKWVEVEFTDPEETLAAKGDFRAYITYSADDPEITG
jgi:hypothetical protein